MNMKIDEQEQQKALRKIIDIRSSEKGCKLIMSNFTKECEFKEGQFVYALHPYASAMQCIGYAVQIRRNAGAFGSDLILIRLANGIIQAWENQSFFSMSEEQIEIARKVFIKLPEQEDFSKGYTTHDQVHEVGFFVEDSKSTPTPVTSSIGITVDKDGNTQHISFLSRG